MSDSASNSKSTRVAELDALLRRCIQCGLCLPHCATWLATGNEVLSPRGRLVLLAEMLSASAASRHPAAADYLKAFDQCIGCRACETACPSGVPFSLLAHGQSLAASAPAAVMARPEPALPNWLLTRLDRLSWLRIAAWSAGAVRTVARLFLGTDWRRRLATAPAAGAARLVGSLPTSPSDAQLLRTLDELCGRTGPAVAFSPPSPSPTAQVAFFRGCANAGLLPATSRRMRELLTWSGCRVSEPAGQDCCGALADHAGRPGRAARMRARNAAAFEAGAASAEGVVVEAAGCGLVLQQGNPRPVQPVHDAVAFLAARTLPPLGRVPLTVALHDPCHARHGQGILAEPRSLLSAVPGLRVVESAEAEVCCGSGGTWGLRYPELSVVLGRRKAANLVATGADLVVTSNPGCLGQIADALAEADLSGSVRPIVLPLSDLIWYAAVRARP